MKRNFFNSEMEKVHFQDYENFKITYLIEKDFRVLILFVNNKSDDSLIIKRELIRFKGDILKIFEEISIDIIDANTFKKFDNIIYSIQNKLPPIISIVGFSGVGKTSIVNLVRSNSIPLIPDHSISGNIAKIKIGKLIIIYVILLDKRRLDSFGIILLKVVMES